MGISEKIAYLRKKNNWSQEQLAGKLDVSRQAIYKWEANISLPEIDKLKKLSKIFGISYNELLDDEIDITETTVTDVSETVMPRVDATPVNEIKIKKEETEEETTEKKEPEGEEVEPTEKKATEGGETELTERIKTESDKTELTERIKTESDKTEPTKKKDPKGELPKEAKRETAKENKAPLPPKSDNEKIVIIIVAVLLCSIILLGVCVHLAMRVFWNDGEHDDTTEDSTVDTGDTTLDSDTPDPENQFYTVKLFTYSNTIIADRTIKYGDTVSVFTIPKKEGYVFVKWVDKDNNVWDMERDTVKGDLNLYAIYEEKDVKIILDKNDGSGETVELSAKYGEKFNLPECPFERVGYDFFIWTDVENRCAYDDKSFYEVGPNDTYTLSADWTLLRYNILFDYNYDSPTPVISKEYTVEDTIELDTPTREHYVFDGWYSMETDKRINEIPVGTTGTISLYAKWVLKFYQIYYDTNFRDAYTDEDRFNRPTIKHTNPGSYTWDDTVILKAPTIEYDKEPVVSVVFAGWYADEALTIPMGIITKGSSGDKYLYAKWERDAYTIKYNLGGGVNNVSNPTYYKSGDTINLEAPTREFYEFKGWYLDSDYENEIKEITVSTKGNLSLYAKWEHIGYELSERNNSSEYILTKYTGNGVNVEIPSTYNGKTITAILTGAFKGCETIQTLSLPSTISSIGSESFMDMTGLKEITLPNLEILYERTFAGCTSLEKINYLGYPERICEEAFLNCKSLTVIELSSLVLQIEPNAFNGCDGVVEYRVNGSGNGSYRSVDGNLYLGNRLFRYAVGKSDTSFECSVTTHYIGNYAFYGASLTSVKLPDTLGGIGLSAFEGCASLKEIDLGTSVNFIDARAFAECVSLESIVVKSSLSSLGSYAFYNCSALKSAVVKESIGECGYKVFAGCEALESVSLEKSIGKLSASSFEGCANLKSINIPDGITEISAYTFKGCEALTQIALPDTVKKIGDGAFDGCVSLGEIYISSAVTEIEGSPFVNCKGLKALCQAEKAPTGWSNSWSEGVESIQWSYTESAEEQK